MSSLCINKFKSIPIMPQDQKNDKSQIAEPLDTVRRRLKFRSWHRGTREMDMILGRFADTHIEGFNRDQLDQYAELLMYSDPDLYNWLSKNEDLPANADSDVMQLFLQFQIDNPAG